MRLFHTVICACGAALALWLHAMMKSADCAVTDEEVQAKTEVVNA
jgi:hypothetical protein